MALVGHACCEVAGFPFDARRLSISILYGGSCFLADSFIDDYGEAVAREYIHRFEIMLTKGWFTIKNSRERLLYVFLSRTFALSDCLRPLSRQAIIGVLLAQKRDLMLRLNATTFQSLPRARRLRYLRGVARDRSGHALLALTCLVAPEMRLSVVHNLFIAGSLISCTDDHGDCFADRKSKRVTYMNQIENPARILTGMYNDTVAHIRRTLPDSPGKDFLCAFLFRYFVTRLDKHEEERNRGGLSWAVYE